MQQNGLAQMGGVGYVAPHTAGCFFLQRLVNRQRVAGTGYAVSDKADPQAPRKMLLGGPIQFDSQQIGIQPAQTGKKRLLEGLRFKKETEIGVVQNHQQPGAAPRRLGQDMNH